MQNTLAALGLPNYYSALTGGSNSSTSSAYTNLMAAAAARDPSYQALLASGMNGGIGSSASNAVTGLDNSNVDLLQKCKYMLMGFDVMLRYTRTLHHFKVNRDGWIL